MNKIWTLVKLLLPFIRIHPYIFIYPNKRQRVTNKTFFKLLNTYYGHLLMNIAGPISFPFGYKTILQSAQHLPLAQQYVVWFRPIKNIVPILNRMDALSAQRYLTAKNSDMIKKIDWIQTGFTVNYSIFMT